MLAQVAVLFAALAPNPYHHTEFLTLAAVVRKEIDRVVPRVFAAGLHPAGVPCWQAQPPLPRSPYHA